MPTKWNGPKPTGCDIRGLTCTGLHKSFIDGATLGGPWAIMCVPCWRRIGVGLGTGKGQRYNLETLEKMEG